MSQHWPGLTDGNHCAPEHPLDPAVRQESGGIERREAKRFTSLIRASKIAIDHREAICVIRDVSTTGISLRLFHDLPKAERYELALPSGGRYPINYVRSAQECHSFTFAKEVDLGRLVIDDAAFARRQLRVSLCAHALLTADFGQARSTIYNLSQQGALVQTSAILAVEQKIKLEVENLPIIYARVRWRNDDYFGLVFDNTFNLQDFAVRIAVVQKIIPTD